MQINIKHVHAVRKKLPNGKYKTYYYHRFSRKRLPDNPNSIEFMAALEEQSRYGRAKVGTLGSLMTEYKASPEFTQRSKSTKRIYLIQMDKLKPLQDLSISSLTRGHCKKIQTKYSDKPATANMIIAILNNLMRFAVDMEYRKDNPALNIKSIKTGEYRPWTKKEINTFLKDAPQHLFVGVTLGLYTGQRISDCLKMEWDDLEDNFIFVKQMKTGTELHIPCHTTLIETLDNITKNSSDTYILSRKNGKQYLASHFRQLLTDRIKELKLPQDLHFHGLRKSAAVALAEAGCTERQIMSITGHKSFDMVTHYTKGADQKRQAKQAIDKLQNS